MMNSTTLLVRMHTAAHILAVGYSTPGRNPFHCVLCNSSEAAVLSPHNIMLSSQWALVRNPLIQPCSDRALFRALQHHRMSAVQRRMQETYLCVLLDAIDNHTIVMLDGQLIMKSVLSTGQIHRGDDLSKLAAGQWTPVDSTRGRSHLSQFLNACRSNPAAVTTPQSPVRWMMGGEHMTEMAVLKRLAAVYEVVPAAA